MKTQHFFKPKSSPVGVLLLILVGLAILFSSCTFNVPAVDPSKRQTDVARSVESTLNAEKIATYQAQQTLDAGQPIATQPDNPNTNATIQAQQATLDSQSTSLSPQVNQPAPSDTPQVAPTLVPSGSLDPIQILDWKMSFWVSLPNGCKGDTPCWRTNDDYNKHLGISPLVLTSKQGYLVDPNWPKPYLVFWHKLENANPVTVEVIIDGTPIAVRQYPKGRKDWVGDAVDLSSFKGKEIVVRFVATGKSGLNWGGNPGTNWFVENIQILPNYKP
jgi:hypothetical protein